MQNFKQLKVWEKAHELTLAIYTATQNFPKEERYSLTDQMRRSSSSIPTNLAEGSGRGSDIEYNKLDKQLGEVRAMLIAFRKKFTAQG